MRWTKKFLFPLFACLALSGMNPSVVGAQDANPLQNLWSRLNNVYINSGLINTRDASEVEIMLKAAIDHSSKTWGEESNETLQSSLELLKLYRMQARFSEMKPYIARVASVFPKLESESKLYFAPIITELSRELLYQDRNNEAKRLLSPVVSEVKTDKHLANDHALLNKLKELGSAYQSKNDSETAQKVAGALLFACEHNQPINEAELASARLRLAEILKTDNNAAALELATMALESEERLFGAGSEKSIRTLIFLSSHYLASSRTSEAVQTSEKLIAALERPTQTKDRSQLSNEILALCQSFAQAGEEKPVSRLFEKALDSVTDRHGFYQFDNTLKQVAQSTMARKSPDDVEALFVTWQRWSEKPASLVDSNYSGQLLVSFMRFYIQQGMFDKVDPLLAKLTKVNTNNTFSQVSSLFQEIESSPNVVVKEKLCKFLADDSNISFTDKRQLAYYRSKLSGIYVQNGQYKDAMRIWTRCTALMKDSLPADCKDIVAECQTLFDRYAKEKRFSDAQNLATGMASYGFDGNIVVRVANGFSALSQHREALGDTVKAASLMERSIAVSEHYGGKQSHNYADALARHAQLLKRLGRTELAMEREKQAADLRQELQRLGINRYG